MKLTKKILLNLPYGTILHHKTAKNADKTPMRVKITGKLKIWKTMKHKFSLPVRYGMPMVNARYFRITELTASEFELAN